MQYLLDNSVCFALVTVLIASLCCFKLAGGKELHQFSKDNTLGLRGLMAILIILCHTSHEFLDDCKVGFAVAFGPFIVGMFFFLSGYGLVKSYLKNSAVFMDRFLPRNLAKILPALILATGINMLLMCLFFGESPIAMLSGCLKGMPPLPYSWFMYALLAFYLFFYLCFRLIKRPRYAVLSLFVLTIALYLGLRALNWGVYWYLSLFSFNIGTVIALFERKILALVKSYVFLSVSVVAVGIIITNIWGIRNGMVLWSVAVYLIIVMAGGLKGRLCMFLGGCAYEIYLAHGLVVPNTMNLGLGYMPTLMINIVLSIMLALPLKLFADSIKKPITSIKK